MLQHRKKMLTEEKQERRKTGGGTTKVITEQSEIDILLDKNIDIALESVQDSDSFPIHMTSPELFYNENNEVTITVDNNFIGMINYYY